MGFIRGTTLYENNADLDYIKLQNVKGGGTYKVIFPRRDEFINKFKDRLKVLTNSKGIVDVKVDTKALLHQSWYSVVISVDGDENTFVSLTTNGLKIEVGLRNFGRDLDENIIKKLKFDENENFLKKYDKGKNKWWYFVRSESLNFSMLDQDKINEYVKELQTIHASLKRERIIK